MGHTEPQHMINNCNMKHISFLVTALVGLSLINCKGNSSNDDAEYTDSDKLYEEEQMDESFLLEIDSLALDFGDFGALPIIQDSADEVIELTNEEKIAKPEYLLSPATGHASTIAEKYRKIGALSVDREIAYIYHMSPEDYEKAIMKLASEVNDPSLTEMGFADNAFQVPGILYEAMSANDRGNYYWQIATASFIEQLFITSQNPEKFIDTFDDEAVAKVFQRLSLLRKTIGKLTKYDSELEPVMEAIRPLANLKASTTDEFKALLINQKEQIATARKALVE